MSGPGPVPYYDPRVDPYGINAGGPFGQPVQPRQPTPSIGPAGIPGMTAPSAFLEGGGIPGMSRPFSTGNNYAQPTATGGPSYQGQGYSGPGYGNGGPSYYGASAGSPPGGMANINRITAQDKAAMNQAMTPKTKPTPTTTTPTGGNPLASTDRYKNEPAWAQALRKLGYDPNDAIKIHMDPKDPLSTRDPQEAARRYVEDRVWEQAAWKAGILTGNTWRDQLVWQEHYMAKNHLSGRDPLEGHPEWAQWLMAKGTGMQQGTSEDQAAAYAMINGAPVKEVPNYAQPTYTQPNQTLQEVTTPNPYYEEHVGTLS